MASTLFRRLPTRMQSRPSSLTPAFRTTVATQRNASGDLGNPQSVSSEQSDIKTSRATDGGSPDTASIQTPVSNQSAIPGDQDEGTPSHDKVKRNPSEPVEKKRAHVESQGKKPLGPEDHQ